MPSRSRLLFATILAAAMTIGSAAARADCLKDAGNVWEKNADVRSHLTADDLRSLNDLRRAAVVLRAEGKDGACNGVAHAIDDILDDRRDKMVEAGVILSESEQERRQRYQAARPLGEAGTVIRSSDLIGTDVRNMKGDRLGEVDDVYVDAGENNVSYLIVERGGFLGIGENVVAIPTDRVAVTEDADTIVLDMDREAFEKAPELEKRDMIGDADWRQRNTAFFARP